MPISALPESTVRLLGSGITITTPSDLVKELIENAIDAQANSIEVVISPDSVSQIAVRDDGHGIDVDDFASLGRRSHTSKLKSFDELKTRAGGDTLGFRGEALASINSIATMSITTRTKNDPVASLMGLKVGVGGIENLRKISAPVGTIVQVSKLFENLPARKQYALKNGHKTMSKIKDLLKTYALARPYIRFSLKVSEGGPKGASKSTWSYNPNQSPTVHEAVLQIFRKDLASNCVHVSCQLGPEKLVPLHVKLPPAIAVDAFIPAPGCSDKVVRGKGAHISIDSRPLSCARGLPKKIVSMFRSHLGDAMRSHGSSTSLTNPFIQLNIICPPCSYDSNVTPLKDEVVFADESRLLECLDSMFRKFYQVNHATDGGCDEIPSHEMSSSNSLRPHAKAPNSRTDPGIAPSDKAFAGQTPNLKGKRNQVPLTSTLTKASLPEEPPRRAHAAQAGGSPSRLLQEAGKPSRQSARMRLKKAVNMARTDSNISDDTTVGETLVVEMPPLSPVREIQLSNAEPRVKPKTPAAQLTFENIERYFWPSQNKDFQIAEDRTATTGEQLADQLTLSQSDMEHRALQELGESAINEIQGLEEPESNFFPIRTEDSSPHQAMGGNVRVPRPVRGPRMTGNREVTRLFQGTPPSSSPQSRGQQLSDVSSPQVAASVHGIRTPPSSDPPVGHRNPNPPFQSHRRNTQPQETHRDIPGDRFGMDSPIRNRVSLGQMPHRTNMPERSMFPSAIQRPMPSGNLFNTNVEAPVHDVSSPAHSRPQGTRADFSSAWSSYPMASRGSRFSSDHMEWNVPRQDQHQNSLLPQSLSVRNQLIDSNKRKADNAAWKDQSPWYGSEETATQASPRLLDGRNHNPASEAEVPFGSGDHPSKRLCTRPRDTQPSRLCLGLGLQITPDDMKMQAVSTCITLGREDIERWRHMLSRWEPYIFLGKSEASLPFRTMEEVRTMEAVLRERVKTWMKKSNQELTVEYTLQSTAKGKRAS